MSDPATQLASRPRWDGRPGRMEVWYGTASDPLTGAGLWVHYETVAPTEDQMREPYGHGWCAFFPADDSPRCERFGPTPITAASTTDSLWHDASGQRAEPDHWTGAAGSMSWDMTWHGDSPPVWTFPEVAWSRELLPGAQVLARPEATLQGTITVADRSHDLDGWLGGIAHIYSHGSAKRWGWLHADLGHGDLIEIVTAQSHAPGLNLLPPLAFIRFRLDGRDWPSTRLPSLRMRTRLSLPRWELAGIIDSKRVTITVDQPHERCVALEYTDPDGARSVCTNTEQADLDIQIEHRLAGQWFTERRWRLDGTAHAEVGLRGAEAPVPTHLSPAAPDPQPRSTP